MKMFLHTQFLVAANASVPSNSSRVVASPTMIAHSLNTIDNFCRLQKQQQTTLSFVPAYQAIHSPLGGDVSQSSNIRFCRKRRRLITKQTAEGEYDTCR